MTSAIKRLVPRRHFTTYGHEGRQYFATWRQWGNRIWSHTRFDIGAWDE